MMKQFIQHQGKINEDQERTNAQTSQAISIKSLQVFLKRKVSSLLKHNKIQEVYVKFQK